MKRKKRPSNFGKKLGPRSREDILWKAKNGLVLSLRELGISTGYGYDQWRLWARRGLPLVKGKVSLKRALDWIRSEEMAPYGRTSEVFNLCDRLASALIDIRIDLKFRHKPNENKYLQEETEKLLNDYRLILKRQCIPLPLRAVPYMPLIEFEDRLPTAPMVPVPDKPVHPTEAATIRMSRIGAALKMRGLALATGYSYGMIRQWKKDGLPLVDGRITAADAVAWRKNFVAAEKKVPGD